jgi:hypothetical protein
LIEVIELEIMDLTTISDGIEKLGIACASSDEYKQFCIQLLEQIKKEQIQKITNLEIIRKNKKEYVNHLQTSDLEPEDDLILHIINEFNKIILPDGVRKSPSFSKRFKLFLLEKNKSHKQQTKKCSIKTLLKETENKYRDDYESLICAMITSVLNGYAIFYSDEKISTRIIGLDGNAIQILPIDISTWYNTSGLFRKLIKSGDFDLQTFNILVNFNVVKDSELHLTLSTYLNLSYINKKVTNLNTWFEFIQICKILEIQISF